MKLALKILVAILVVLSIAAAAGYIYADSLARESIERGATYALGVETDVDSTDLGLIDGELTLEDLTIDNPEGFPTEHFLELERGSVEVTLGTLLEDVVEIPELRLVGLDVVLERSGGKSNYEVILANLRGREKSEEETPRADGGKGYIVRELVLEDVDVRVDLLPTDLLPIGGDLTNVTVPLDEIRLSDVGSETGRGVLLWELSGILVKSVLAAVVQNGGGVIPDDLRQELEDELASLESLAELGIEMSSQLEETLNRAVDEVEEAVRGATEEIEDAAERARDAIEGVEDILKGKKPPGEPLPPGREPQPPSDSNGGP